MKPALILVDIQNDYFEKGRMELVHMDRAAENANRLLAAFRKACLPIVHVQHKSLREGASFFLPETRGVEIHESVTPLPRETVMVKHWPNSFRETGLLEHLKAAAVEDVVLCGAMSHMCIDATTRAAFDLGFRCFVADDGCATRDLVHNGKTVKAEHVHTAFMAALASVYAEVISTSEWLERLAATER